MTHRLLFFVLAVFSLLQPRGLRSSAAPGPIISNPRIQTPVLARFDRFEADFDLVTSSAYPYLPYDPRPPKGMDSIQGVSADVLFISPSGNTYLQPAFYYQPVEITQANGLDHALPSGKAYWKVRFTPQDEGTWRLRFRAIDAGGLTLFPLYTNLTFTVTGMSPNAYAARGFLRVSRADPRYFEFQDGTPFIPTGFNGGFGSLEQAERTMGEYEQNRINFIRVWMSGGGINGSQWSPWASLLPYNGYLPATSLDFRDTYAGHDLAFRLDDTNPCLFQGWQGGPVAVQPGARYTLWARVKTENVGPQGFVIKTGGWLEKQCADPSQGQAITRPLSGTSAWTEVSGQVTASGPWLDNLYLARQGSTGRVLIDEVRLYRSDDPAQVNILRQPSPNSHLSFDPVSSARWDAILSSAEKHGVYFKLVIDEKNEWIRNHLAPDGAFTDQGDNNNFYAAPGTKSRWLQTAWWRYLIARWGYSTAIHSFEYINEGDPYNSRHYEAAQAMAEYIHRCDINRHMVTTSFWAAFPNREFWSNPLYAAIDYADLHAYLTTGWTGGSAAFLGAVPADATVTKDAPASARLDAHVAGSFPITPRGLALREQGEWLVRYRMKADHFTVSCPYNGSGGMQWVRWSLDGGPASGGKTGIVPENSEGKDFICSSPAGTYDWRPFRSDQDRDGKTIPVEYRLIINDSLPHEIMLSLENINSTGGAAWISDVELVSPSGKIVPVIGQFDPTAMTADTAWYNAAYGLLYGGGSPVGAGKPLVRGEGAVNLPGQDGYLKDLNKDYQGVWLHNDLWAQVGPGGMADLMWWSNETIAENKDTGRVPGLYPVFLAYQNFMDGIPLNNGRYRDAQAQASDARLRAWGQRDDSAGRALLWIQNRIHTWQVVISGQAIPPLTGEVTLPGFPAGSYRVEWWDTYATTNQVIKTEQVKTIGGNLTLTLPAPLTSDIAAKITPVTP